MHEESQHALIQLKTPPHLRPEAKTLMEQHGCLVEEGRVTLPAASSRTPCLQIVTVTIWFEIILPDQYRMLEAYDWRREISVLYLSAAEKEHSL